ncbi:MAG: metallophosphoesterase [Ruminococcus sp.]|nr:metallophosphoesterase [Ruminococcus sp.]
MDENVTPQQSEPAAANKPPSKAKYRRRRLCAILVILLLVWWFNNYTLRTTKVKLTSPKIKEKVRIAVISDLHASTFGISNRTVFRRIDKYSPDLVFILGDMYTTGSREGLKQRPVDLAEDIVDAGYPVYFVPGEHDYDPEYLSSLRKAGAKVMNYKSEDIDIGKNKLTVYGIDNVYYSDTFDLRNEFRLDRSRYNILLAHIPNYEKFALFGADLTLCGDTHGNMMQLPFDLGPVYDSDSHDWFPQFGKSPKKVYDKGVFPYNSGNMFITSGIGDSPFPIRFNNRPEVVIIDISPE